MRRGSASANLVFRGQYVPPKFPACFRSARMELHQNATSNLLCSDMTKALVLEKHQFAHMAKVAAVTGQSPQRDVALLAVAYGIGLQSSEVARLAISDFLLPNGVINRETVLRAEIAFNGKERPLYWTARYVTQALDDYLAARLAQGHGVTTRPQEYRGLDGRGPLFLTSAGTPLLFTKRHTSTGRISYSCESLTAVYRKLHHQAGIENGSATAARRTFSVHLRRNGVDLDTIRRLLGLSSLSAVKRIVDSDPVRLGAIVSRVI
jgi:site-specific recombinase XerD